MFDVLNAKNVQYLPRSLAQAYVNRMYAKLTGPYVEGEVTNESTAKGVQRFDELMREGETSPYRELGERMRDIIFDGTCDIQGYRRSTRALGLNLGGGEGIRLTAELAYMTTYLIHATQLAIAEAFGDDEFAAEQVSAIEDLATPGDEGEVSLEHTTDSRGATAKKQTCPKCGKEVLLKAPPSTFYAICPECKDQVYVGP